MTSDDDTNALQPLMDEARMHGGHVFRDEQQITADGVKLLRERFGSYLQRTGLSQEKAARSMSLAASTISQVLSGNYAADAEKPLRMIDRWLENRLQQETGPKAPGFVKIALAESIYGVVRWATKTNSIVLVCGPNGCGKTMTLHAIRAETPGAVYYSIATSGRSARAVLDGIAEQVRISGLGIGTSKLFAQVAAVLKDTGRLIMIDECHKCAGRQNDDALHMLRDLHDATGCPMVFAGNGKIAKYLRDNKTEGNDPIDQIFGRISWWLDLTEKASGGGADDGTRLYTVEEIQRIFAASKIRLTPDAASYLTDLANDGAMGCLRLAKNLVAMALVAARGEAISASMLRTIQRERLGQRAAEMADLRAADLATRAVA